MAKRVHVLDLVPVRDRDHRMDGDVVVVLVPRFDGILGKLITKQLTNPCYKVHLDRLGSEVWHLCDGARTGRDIANELRRKLGDEIEPAEERVRDFIRRLERGRCISLRRQGE